MIPLGSTHTPENSGDRATPLIFVYGSLKRGYALHHLLNSQTLCGSAVTKPLYRLFDLGTYPGIVEWPNGLSVQGEVYKVDDECLRRLDEAEGVAEGCYARRPIQLEPPFDHFFIHAWFWLRSVRGLKDCGPAWPAA